MNIRQFNCNSHPDWLGPACMILEYAWTSYFVGKVYSIIKKTRMREFQDLWDLFPYCLLVVLPVFIALSPINPCDATHEFPVHRLAHFELGNALFGSKIASISLEARAKTSSSAKVLRKVVVAGVGEISVAGYNDLASAGAGGILLLVPPSSGNNVSSSLSPEVRESILSFEEHALNGEMEVPVYFAEETPELLELLEDLKQDGSSSSSSSSSSDQNVSGARALIDGIVSNGFQLVTAAGNPKALTDQSMVSIQGTLAGISESGLGEEDTLPTIVIAAYYDASGMAPTMSYGADSNGSGVTILMELARIWGLLYRSSKSRPKYNLVFLLSGGGKINFLGTKKWLDEQKDDQSSEMLSNLKLAICLDSLGQGDSLNMYVSKPPKEGSLAHNFLTSLQILAKELYPKVKVNLVHKKINLATEYLAWEHERFSIHKLNALTLSHYETSNLPEKSSILDRHVDQRTILRNTHLLGEALACTIFKLGKDHCMGAVFSGDLAPSAEAVAMWTEEMASKPRATSLLVGSAKSLHQIPIVKTLSDSLRIYVEDVKHHLVKREKRDPEYTFYDNQQTTMSSYRVKPAVFDLVLTVSIAGYLGLVYLILTKWSSVFVFLASLTQQAASSVVVGGGKAVKQPEMNGNGKLKAH